MKRLIKFGIMMMLPGNRAVMCDFFYILSKIQTVLSDLGFKNPASAVIQVKRWILPSSCISL